MDDAVLIDLLVEFAGLEEELAGITAARDARRRRLDVIGLGREADREAADEAAGRRAESEARARGRRARIADTRVRLDRKRSQLAGIGDRRQYEALQGEIARLEEDLDRLETDELVFLEEEEAPREPTTPAVQVAAGEVAELEAAQAKAALAREEILAELDRLTGMVPAPHQGHLRRLRRQGGPAVVRIEERACGGCGALLPHQRAIDAARGKAVVRCPSCARFVVRPSYR